MKYLTTKEVAAKLNYEGDAQIRKLISRGKIKAEKIGRMWVIPVEELVNIKRVRKQYKKKTS